MLVKVTKHAIKRYRERLFDYSSSDGEIISKLKHIAHRGRLVAFKPHDMDNCVELKYEGISIVAVQQPQELVIITCLGQDNYRKWIKSKGMCTYVSQRLRFGN
ncbi:MAG: hypothetical protein GXZ09_00305 [Syntrophomonadaceae bacterium]|jgi:hypothetical protein|nr:hypothetical protein [Syntrophomonadaceae bacterium]